ncbi:protein lifeguard 1-like [Argonauta hians]
MPSEDLGSNEYALEFSDKSIRMAFVRNVYGILSLQLLLTLVIIGIFIFVEGVKYFALQNLWLFYVAIAVTVVITIILSICQGVRRHFPVNLFMLYIFTLCEGVLLGFISSFYSQDAVMMAVGVTALVSVALTLFAFQTKWDFTTMGGMLFVFLIVLIIFGFLCMIIPNRMTSLVYSCAAALLFSLYLVYDTQLMLGGKHRYSLSPEEYIFAALNLYIDIVQIFQFNLSMFGNAND